MDMKRTFTEFILASTGPSSTKRLIIGITGASGALYGVRLLLALSGKAEIHLICSDVAASIIKQEVGWDMKKEPLSAFAERSFEQSFNDEQLIQHNSMNFYASISSGSFPTDGMIVAPCSMKTLSGIAQGSSRNLIERAADVTLKERRPLVLLTREMPLNRIHLQNMLTAHDAGAVICPASPAFYLGEQQIMEQIDFVVGRCLNLVGVDHQLFTPWGMK